MSENKKIEKEQIVEKKSPNVLVTVLCIVLIIAMFFVGWFAGGANSNIKKDSGKTDKQQTEEVEKEDEKEIVNSDINLKDDLSKKVKILEGISEIDIADLNPDIEGYYRSGDIYAADVKVSQISEDLGVYNVIEYLYDLEVTKSIKNQTYYNGNLDFSVVDNEYKSLFGKDISEHKNLEGCPLIVFDSVNNIYNVSYECGGTSPIVLNTYINRITTKGNNAYVYVNLGVLNYVESKVYTEYEAKNLYDGAIDDFDMEPEVINESNYKDFSEYKYTFVNEDGNYIFKSLERIK